jgi:hypothetical protein
MPVDPGLHEFLRSATEDAPTVIDTAAVIRRSKAKRLPRQIGLATAYVAVAAGIFAGAMFGLTHIPFSTSGGSESAATRGQHDVAPTPATGDSAGKGALAAWFPVCGTAPKVSAAAAGRLAATVTFPDAASGSHRVLGTVTVTNTGSTTIRGTSDYSPIMSLLRSGNVVWHSNPSSVDPSQAFSLAPGQFMTFTASFSALRCTAQNESSDGGPLASTLPALAAGSYDLIAQIDLRFGGSTTILTSSASSIRVR